MAAPQDLRPGTGPTGPPLASDTIKVHGSLGWLAPLIGQIRIRVTGTVLALIAFACITVPVRLAVASRADGRPPGREH